MESVSAGKHLLIVDDYADALDVWATYLESLGFRVSTAADGTAALAKARRLLPDLIVLDLELPGVSGSDVAVCLRADPRTQGIPLIAATGYCQVGHLETARRAGFDAIVVKPCDPDSLVHEIERLLETSQPADEPGSTSVEHGSENG